MWRAKTRAQTSNTWPKLKKPFLPIPVVAHHERFGGSSPMKYQTKYMASTAFLEYFEFFFHMSDGFMLEGLIFAYSCFKCLFMVNQSHFSQYCKKSPNFELLFVNYHSTLYLSSSYTFCHPSLLRSLASFKRPVPDLFSVYKK